VPPARQRVFTPRRQQDRTHTRAARRLATNPDDGSDTRKLYVEQRELSDAGWCQSLRVDTRLANKLRAWYLRAVAKGALENGKADAPLSETTATAARTAAAATVSLKTAAAARSAVAKPNRSRAPRRSHQYFARRRDDLTNG
jgi:hypothetical protein